MAKNVDFMVATIKVAIPAPTTLQALGKLAAEYAAELGKVRAWGEGPGRRGQGERAGGGAAAGP